MWDSNVSTGAYYVGALGTLTFDPAPGTYDTWSYITVHITCSTPYSTIRYTTDGTEPNSNSTLYTSDGVKLYCVSTTTLKAAPFHSDGTTMGTVCTGIYHLLYGNPDHPPAPGLPLYKVQDTIILHNGGISNLWIPDADETNSVSLQWVPYYNPEYISYNVRRIDPNGTETQVANGISPSSFTDAYCPLESGSSYMYRVQVASASDPDLYPNLPAPPADADPIKIYHHKNYVLSNPSNWDDPDNWSVPVAITPARPIVSSNQSVDTRLDRRYAENRPLNFQFKKKTYRGGLYAGYAPTPDYSRVGRSFLKFELPAIPSGDPIWAGKLRAYNTRSAEDGNTTVGCYHVSVNVWNADTLDWAGSPALGTLQSTVTVNYDSSNPVPSWRMWPVTGAVRTQHAIDGWLSLALASTSESTSGWTYFAKKEYGDGSTAPRLLVAFGNTVIAPSSITLSSSSVQGGATVTGTVQLNTAAPTGGLIVAICSNSVKAVTEKIYIPAGATQGSFNVYTSTVSSQTPVKIYAVMSPGSIYTNLTINP